MTFTDNRPADAQVYKHVWVINDSDSIYKEKFKGKVLEFGPKERKKMSRHEAASFRGQFPGDKVEKRIKIEPIFPNWEPKQFKCQITGETFDSQEALDMHLTKMREKLVKKGR